MQAVRGRSHRIQRTLYLAIAITISVGGFALLRRDGEARCGTAGADAFCADQIVALCLNYDDSEDGWDLCVRRINDSDVRVVRQVGGGRPWLGSAFEHVLVGRTLVRPNGSSTKVSSSDGLTWFGSTGHLLTRRETGFEIIDTRGLLVDTIPYPNVSAPGQGWIRPTLSHDENSLALFSSSQDNKANLVGSQIWVFDRVGETWRSFDIDDYYIGLDQVIGWSDDDRQIIAASVPTDAPLGGPRSALIATDVSSGAVSEISRFDLGYSHHVVSPDGRLIAIRFRTETADGIILDQMGVVVAETGELSDLVPLGGRSGGGVEMSWSQDSRHLLADGFPILLVAVLSDGSVGDVTEITFDDYGTVLGASFAAAG